MIDAVEGAEAGAPGVEPAPGDAPIEAEDALEVGIGCDDFPGRQRLGERALDARTQLAAAESRQISADALDLGAVLLGADQHHVVLKQLQRARTVGQIAQARPLIGDDAVDARWSALNALVRARWDSDLARSRVAADLGVAPETVSRLCRRHGGCTFLDLVRRERLAHAEILLRDHGRTVAEVAAACRLGSGTWLARLTRRQRGRAPRRG